MSGYTVFFSKQIDNFEIGISYYCRHSKEEEDFKDIYDGCERKVYLKYTF